MDRRTCEVSRPDGVKLVRTNSSRMHTGWAVGFEWDAKWELVGAHMTADDGSERSQQTG